MQNFVNQTSEKICIHEALESQWDRPYTKFYFQGFTCAALKQIAIPLQEYTPDFI